MDGYFPFLVAFIFGLCIGSFINVCIYRIPAGKSIVRPASSCPVCNHTIAAYDNIPVLSYLLLLGRCRYCKTSISIRYPIVELLIGVMAVSALSSFGLTPEALIYFCFSTVLITVTFIDIDHQIIPDVISLPGIIIFFIASFFLPPLGFFNRLIQSLLGVLSGGGSLYLVAWGYFFFTGKEGMGGGDIKLLAMIGALLGWQGVLFTIFAGSSIGCIAGLLVMLKQRSGVKTAVPFGPFLSIGALLYTFWGPRIINWYFGLLG
jgi:leader peptidase (prepilin peptidase) / N-methyltransferase